MSERSTGWAFVAVQAVLIAALVVVPAADHYSVPTWLEVAANACFWSGVVLAVLAAAFLGRSLTATPVPSARAALRTSGPYRFVRHPIYTGVVLIVVGLAVRSGNVIGVVLGLVTLAFFHRKATWEEQRLRARFAEYDAYAAVTPRFLPRPWSRR